MLKLGIECVQYRMLEKSHLKSLKDKLINICLQWFHTASKSKYVLICCFLQEKSISPSPSTCQGWTKYWIFSVSLPVCKKIHDQHFVMTSFRRTTYCAAHRHVLMNGLSSICMCGGFLSSTSKPRSMSSYSCRAKDWHRYHSLRELNFRWWLTSV